MASDEDVTLSDEISELQRWLHDMEMQCAKVRGQQEETANRLSNLATLLVTAKDEEEETRSCSVYFQGMEEVWQKNFGESVAKLISRGLTQVFGEPMELKINTRILRDVSSVEFTIVQGAGEDAIETPIVGAKGGTVIALVNVLLRALVILSSRPPLRRWLILDEPFGLADPTYIPAFGSLLRELVDQLHFNITIVSHEESLIDHADQAYEAYTTRKAGTAFRLVHDRNEVRA